MKNGKRLFLFLLTGILMYSCATVPHKDIVVAEFGNYKITMDEFEKAYVKNLGSEELAKKNSIDDYKNFLDLYTNYRMKLRDSEVRAYDRDVELTKEYQNYKRDIGKSIILEKEIIQPHLKETYERRKWEYRLAHIYLKIDSTGEEACKAKAMKIIDELNKGANWDSTCLKYSLDKATYKKGGDVYWVTAGYIFPELEESVYSMNKGEVYQEPIKSKFGYHIVKVTDKQKRKAKVKARHILIRTIKPATVVEDEKALSRIQEALEKLKNGEDFAKVAKKYSEDPGSRDNGGELGYFERGNMVRPFDEVAFKLKEGETSDIVRTRYGYHIIRVDSIKYEVPFSEEAEHLREVYKKNRYQYDYDNYTDSLKTVYGYKLNENGLNELLSVTDSLKFNFKELNDELLGKVKNTVIFSMKGNEFTADTLLRRAVKNKDFANRTISKEKLEEMAEKLSRDIAIELQIDNYENENSNFATIMNDYRNGIYIFKLQDEEVWNKVKVDSVALKDFYEKTKENYKWPDRVEFIEVNRNKKEDIDSLYNLVLKGKDISEVAAESTERPGYKMAKGHFVLVDVNHSPLTQEAAKYKENELSKPFKVEGKWSFVKVIKKEPSRIKTFKEAYTEVSSAYQEYKVKELENEYISRLKNIYEPELYYDKLQYAFKAEKK